VIEPAGTDVVGPSVAADDPDRLAHECAEQFEQLVLLACAAGSSIARGRFAATPPSSLVADRQVAAVVDARRTALARVGRQAAFGRCESSQQRAGGALLGVEAEANAEPELGVVLEQAVAPRRAAALVVGAVRSGGQVAAVDAAATGGVGDQQMIPNNCVRSLRYGVSPQPEQLR
jgi:hypothetical protein